MKAVVSASWESVPYPGRQGWNTRVRWACRLSCGHTIYRYGPGNLKKPARARCEVCGPQEVMA